MNPSIHADSKISEFIREIYHQFISQVISEDCEIIFIYDNWEPISSAKFLQQTSIQPFLTRLKYPVIPEEYSQFEQFFKELGIRSFELNDLVELLFEKIPDIIEFENSIFESYKEYAKIVEYMNRYVQQLPKNGCDIHKLNIMPVEGQDNKILLMNAKDYHVFDLPDELFTIKKELGCSIIDKKMYNKFNGLYNILGCKKFNYNDMINILENDIKENYRPISLEKAPLYINSKDKLILIIDYIRPYLKFFNNNMQGLKSGIIFDINKNIVAPKTRAWEAIKESITNFSTVSIILDVDNQLNRVNNNRVFDLYSSDELKEFARLHQLVNIDKDVKDNIAQYITIPKLSIELIIELIKKDIKNLKAINDDYLILIYKLLLAEKQCLKGNKVLINEVKSLQIFKNSKNELCSLMEENKEIFFQGDYSVPIEIGQVLNEDLIKKVPGFKEYILSECLGIQKLTFDLLIKRYFIEIFNKNDTTARNKLLLIDELNKYYDKVIANDHDGSVKEILQKSKIILCQDKKFHAVSEGNIYFKSEEIDQILNYDYYWPFFENVDKYEHMLKAIGVMPIVTPETIVEHIKKITNKNIDIDLINHIKNIFVHLNMTWDEYHSRSFEKTPFSELSNIKWLPATTDDNNLYKPSSLYTQNSKEQSQNTKLLLWCLPDILYLDITDADLI